MLNSSVVLVLGMPTYLARGLPLHGLDMNEPLARDQRLPVVGEEVRKEDVGKVES